MNRKKKPSSISLKQLHFAALAADVVCFRIAHGALEALLGRVTSNNVFKGKWAHIGGLIRVSETAEEAVGRLLRDKAGVTDVYKEQLYTFSAVDRDPRGRVVSVAYLALAEGDDIQEPAKAGVPTAWRSVAGLSQLAYDHDDITRVALERLRSKIMFTDIARHLLPLEFTFSDLQKVYEIVLGEGMDKRNFRKRILSLNIVEDTGRTMKKGVMRPAALYAFKTQK